MQALQRDLLEGSFHGAALGSEQTCVPAFVTAACPLGVSGLARCWGRGALRSGRSAALRLRGPRPSSGSLWRSRCALPEHPLTESSTPTAHIEQQQTMITNWQAYTRPQPAGSRGEWLVAVHHHIRPQRLSRANERAVARRKTARRLSRLFRMK